MSISGRHRNPSSLSFLDDRVPSLIEGQDQMKSPGALPESVNRESPRHG